VGHGDCGPYRKKETHIPFFANGTHGIIGDSSGRRLQALLARLPKPASFFARHIVVARKREPLVAFVITAVNARAVVLVVCRQRRHDPENGTIVDADVDGCREPTKRAKQPSRHRVQLAARPLVLAWLKRVCVQFKATSFTELLVRPRTADLCWRGCEPVPVSLGPLLAVFCYIYLTVGCI
jgi:hypothetical protein